MSLDALKERCIFYQKMGLLDKEKEFLGKSLEMDWNWSWGRDRIKELDPGYLPVMRSFIPEADIKPESKEEILQRSHQYQRELRFEREHRLIEHALKLHPNWHYLHERKEWHSRPEFHRDPEKSRVQPRQSLNLPRNAQYIPKQETIDSMCFVTASGSDQPYFDLSIQLLESIKATRWYNHVPIKVLDCGLTNEDAEYLRSRFGAEVKDPGWDVDPSSIKTSDRKDNPLNGWKGCTARPYIAKHFPGYEYYFWLDTDTWIQDEYGLDHIVCLAEKHGIGAVAEHLFKWPKVCACFTDSISPEHLKPLDGEYLLHNALYCMNKSFAFQYMDLCDALYAEQENYIFGFDMSSFNVLFYRQYKGTTHFICHESSCLVQAHMEGLNIGEHKELQRININHPVGIVALSGGTKTWGYTLLARPNEVYTRKCVAKDQQYCEERRLLVSKICNLQSWSVLYRSY